MDKELEIEFKEQLEFWLKNLRNTWHSQTDSSIKERTLNFYNWVEKRCLRDD